MKTFVPTATGACIPHQLFSYLLPVIIIIVIIIIIIINTIIIIIVINININIIIIITRPWPAFGRRA